MELKGKYYLFLCIFVVDIIYYDCELNAFI